MRFSDKVVVITGAGSGIGEGIAEEFGQAGATVVIAEMNAGSGRRVEQKLTGMGIRAEFIQVDVADERSAAQAATRISESLGTIDALVNNAGVKLSKGFLETSSEEWDTVLGVHLKGVFLMSKHCIPFMQHSATRSIVNISSVHAFETLPNFDAYAAAKGGVVSLTRSMAQSLRALRVRVNCICPGYIQTPMWRHQALQQAQDPDRLMEHLLSFHLTDRIGNPGDVARAAMFLSSEDAAFVNGHVMMVDGGVTTQLPS